MQKWSYKQLYMMGLLAVNRKLSSQLLMICKYVETVNHGSQFVAELDFAKNSWSTERPSHIVYCFPNC
jgi:hypothetical protein